jgi:hypothetical protein
MIVFSSILLGFGLIIGVIAWVAFVMFITRKDKR